MDGLLDNNTEVTCCFCGQGLRLNDAALLVVYPNVTSDESQQLYCHKAHLIDKIDKSIFLHPDFYDDE